MHLQMILWGMGAVEVKKMKRELVVALIKFIRPVAVEKGCSAHTFTKGPEAVHQPEKFAPGGGGGRRIQ